MRARFHKWRPTSISTTTDAEDGRCCSPSSAMRSRLNHTLHVTVTGETVRDEIDPGVTLLDNRSRPMARLLKSCSVWLHAFAQSKYSTSTDHQPFRLLMEDSFTARTWREIGYQLLDVGYSLRVRH
jgi:hypothetical protein